MGEFGFYHCIVLWSSKGRGGGGGEVRARMPDWTYKDLLP